MSLRLAISQEFLNVGVKNKLPMELFGVVEAIEQRLKDEGRGVTPSDTAEISDVIKRNTGLTIGVDLFDGNPVDIGIMVQHAVGHSGTSGKYGHGLYRTDGRQSHYDGFLTSTIDLATGRVNGDFTKVPFTLVLPTGFFTTDLADAEQKTAGLLHEVGHAFFTLATIGEYVWLNYFLTDGIDVVLGRKPNRYKVDVLSAAYMQKHVKDPELAKKLREQPDEACVRRAVLELEGGPSNRGHLRSVFGYGTNRRDEQLADMFVSRMGMGRALATFLHTHAKLNNPKSQMPPMTFRFLDVCNFFVTTGGITAMYMFGGPIGALGASLVLLGLLSTDQGEPSSFYDNEHERLTKLRRDIIAQMRHRDTPETKRVTLEADLKAFDALLEKTQQHRSILSATNYLINPFVRRGRQQLKHEELLESLLNNDLFATAQRFRQS